MREGWEIKKLGEVCDFQGGSQPPKSQFIYEPKDGYVRFLQIRDFASDKNITYIPESRKNRYCKEDDILLGRYGASVGKVLIQKAGAYNVAVMKTIPNEAILFKRYLFFYLNTDDFQTRLINTASRSAQDGFSKDDIFDFPILIPHLSEQQRIVAILDEAFAALDKAKANAEQNLKNAKELFESYLQGVFENKGDGWEAEKLVNLCKLITCGVASTPTYVDESIGIPFLSAQNVRDGEVVLEKYKHISVEFHKELTKKNKPQKGDILYSRVGAKFGEAGVVEHDFEFSVYVSLTLIKPKIEKINNYFLKYLLNSPSIKELANKSIGSSGVPNLNVKDVREFLISYPSLSIQKQIVKEIATMRVETQKLEAVYQQKLADLEELKKSILQKAFAGELTAKSIAS